MFVCFDFYSCEIGVKLSSLSTGFTLRGRQIFSGNIVELVIRLKQRITTFLISILSFYIGIQYKVFESIISCCASIVLSLRGLMVLIGCIIYNWLSSHISTWNLKSEVISSDTINATVVVANIIDWQISRPCWIPGTIKLLVLGWPIHQPRPDLHNLFNSAYLASGSGVRGSNSWPAKKPAGFLTPHLRGRYR